MEKFLERSIERISKWYKAKPYTFTLVLILSCIVLVFSMPAFLTGTWLNKISFDNTGQIGDTIGGLTTPFISLISGLLVYYSFKEQVKANREFAKSRSEDLVLTNINAWLDKITDAVNNYSLSTRSGTDAIEAVLSIAITHMDAYRNASPTDTNFRFMIDNLAHDKIAHITSIVGHINALPRYIKNKKLKYEVYEMQLEIIEQLRSANFLKLYQVIKMLDIYKEAGVIIMPPYSSVYNILQTDELLLELRNNR